MNKPIPERQGKGSSPNSRAALVRTQFKPGQSGNPGGSPKNTPRVDVAYKKLLAMTPEELAVWKPCNGGDYAQATDEGKKKAVSVVEWNKSGTKQKRQAG